MANRRLTTVHVSTQQTWYGGEAQTHLLIDGLRKRGHRVVVFARNGGEFAKRMHRDGFEVREFWRRGRSPSSLWQMRRWLKEIRPEVTHAHDSHALTAVGLASLGLDIPLRVAARRVDFSIRSVSKFKRLADVVIAISKPVAQVCKDGGVPDAMLRVVHSGVDPSRVQLGCRGRGRQVLGVKDDELLILVIANLTGHKGHEYLLTAMPHIVDKFPSARLALAGSGELEETLRQRVRSLGIEDRVRFLGFRGDVPDLFSAADLFVMPSLQEGLCTSLIDAMFAGVPVVATSAGGIVDVVGLDLPDGPCGYVISPGHSEAIGAAVIGALEDPLESKRLAKRAHERATRCFTHTRMIEGTLAVYREWLADALRQSA